MKVENLLDMKGHKVHTIRESETVYEGLKILAKHDVGALLVLDGGEKIVGVFSERDFARRAIKDELSAKDIIIKDMMSKTIYFVKPENNLWDCLDIMTKKRTRHLPVLKEKNLVGIVSIGDIVNRIITEQKSKIEDLESYIIGSDYGATIKVQT
jgi:CBS domain-containing protein